MIEPDEYGRIVLPEESECCDIRQEHFDDEDEDDEDNAVSLRQYYGLDEDDDLDEAMEDDMKDFDD